MRIRVLAAMAVAIVVSTVVSGQEAAMLRATWSEVVTGGKPDEIKVEQVRHYTDRTEVDMDVRARGRIGIGEKVALEAGDAQYAAKGARGIELGKQVDLGVNMTNKKFTIEFEPIGEDVKMFNMRDQYGLRIYAIREGGKETGVVDTYWRDEASGDWVLGVAERHVVVNNRIEKIAKMTNKGDEWKIETEQGTKVEIGKEKRGSEGQRKIKIGGRTMACSKIAGEALPEYPTKDMSEWRDNGYKMGDTVTIIGWLKNCPKIELMISPEFGVTANSIVMSREEISAYGKIDKEGQFVVKMPVENTQEVYIDWRRICPRHRL